MKLSPLYDRVILKRDDANEKSASGLYLPEASRERPQAAIVVACGPGRLKDNGDIVPMPVNVGDRVLIGKYVGDEIKFDGDAIMFVRVDEILSIIDE